MTPWRDKQEIVTGTCSTKMALTVYSLFTFLIQLYNHRSSNALSGMGSIITK